MTFSFKALTSAVLPSGHAQAAHADHKDVDGAPASAHEEEKAGAPQTTISAGSDSDSEVNKIDTSAEAGVQAVQAASMLWTRRDLILVYIVMWFINFFMAFVSSSSSTLAVYVTSAFKEHSLTALTTVIASIISGVWKLPYVKIMNIWGRPTALCIGVASYVVGLITMASCNGVKAYCAAQVFFSVGSNSINFFMLVFIADTSKLKNRGLFLAYSTSPWLITIWIYGYAVNRAIAPGSIGWRWNLGIFAIIAPFIFIPMLYLFVKYERLARKQGLLPPQPSHGNFAQTAVYYLREFDAFGILILAAGLSLFLLGFNLYSLQAQGWKSPMIICFLIFGALFIAAFGVWEKHGAPVTFVPWPLLKNRTVIFTYTMAASLYMAWYIWDSYFYSLLIVLFSQSVPNATYITNIYTVGSCFASLWYGLALRYYGKLKVYSLSLGVPLTMLGVGLMIKFRQPDENIGYIVMCQIFIAVGGAVLVISEQTTLMAVSKQRDFPALMAVEAMVIAIGSAVGSTIAGALWTGVFPARLKVNLPAESQSKLTAIFGSIKTQSSYPVGSPTRDAINLSYGQTQRYMLITATCIYTITLVSVALWQNVDVRKIKQRTVGLL